MGYRLHFAQHYNPEWQGAFFNRDLAAWDLLFDAKFAKKGWRSDSADEYEVKREDIKRYISAIQGSPKVMNKYFTDYTNKAVKEILEEILTSDDDNIRVSWF